MSRTPFWYGALVGVLIGGLTGYALGGFVAMVVLIVGGAAWWTVAMFVGVAIVAAIGWRWLWARRAGAESKG